jgi:hypothetical protein
VTGHRFLWASSTGLTVAPCATEECCGIACPACGRGGSNLSITQLLPQPDDGCIHCGCGYAWAA